MTSHPRPKADEDLVGQQAIPGRETNAVFIPFMLPVSSQLLNAVFGKALQ